MTTEVATTKPTVPVTVNFGGTGLEGIEKSDLVLPKVWLMQGLSALVAEAEKFKAGDIVNSLSEELINPDSPQGPVEVIPITQKKLWYEYDQSGDEKLVRIFDHGHPDSMGIKAGPVEGTPLFYRACIQYYVVLASELEGLPAMINFMKTNYPSGKKLNTFLVHGSMLNQPAWGKAYELKAKKTSNDKGTYYVWEFGGKRVTTDEEKQAAQMWHSVLQTTKVSQEETAEASPSSDVEIPF